MVPGEVPAQQHGPARRGQLVVEDEVRARPVVEPVGRKQGQLAHGVLQWTALGRAVVQAQHHGRGGPPCSIELRS